MFRSTLIPLLLLPVLTLASPAPLPLPIDTTTFNPLIDTGLSKTSPEYRTQTLPSDSSGVSTNPSDPSSIQDINTAAVIGTYIDELGTYFGAAIPLSLGVCQYLPYFGGNVLWKRGGGEGVEVLVHFYHARACDPSLGFTAAPVGHIIDISRFYSVEVIEVEVGEVIEPPSTNVTTSGTAANGVLGRKRMVVEKA